MAGRIVLFGATGHTGALTAEQLAADRVQAVLAGRSRAPWRWTGRLQPRAPTERRDAGIAGGGGAGDELASARLHGVDVYTLTARLLAWGALRLRDGAARAPAGARGRVEAFGLDTMARALAAAGLARLA